MCTHPHRVIFSCQNLAASSPILRELHGGSAIRPNTPNTLANASPVPSPSFLCPPDRVHPNHPISPPGECSLMISIRAHRAARCLGKRFDDVEIDIGRPTKRTAIIHDYEHIIIRACARPQACGVVGIPRDTAPFLLPPYMPTRTTRQAMARGSSGFVGVPSVHLLNTVKARGRAPDSPHSMGQDGARRSMTEKNIEESGP